MFYASFLTCCPEKQEHEKPLRRRVVSLLGTRLDAVARGGRGEVGVRARSRRGVGGGRARTSRRGATPRQMRRTRPRRGRRRRRRLSGDLKPRRAASTWTGRPAYLRNQTHGTPRRKQRCANWLTYVDVQTYGGPADDDVGSAWAMKKTPQKKKKRQVMAPPAGFRGSSPSSRPMPPRRWRSDSGWGLAGGDGRKFPRERFLGAGAQHKAGMRSCALSGSTSVGRMDALCIRFVPDGCYGRLPVLPGP